ncbi:MAG: EVE domain-containing protein [Candidatus Eisenbacteria bacterium]|uniref:EVE domain-containing protein n=1 Tax=Eiseniibacteriota bacterium TaxID=2212470 RepID=A0A948RXV8_UNCEI|nr:EVE domain-containing protein [Candidatus Eisenbacteria bacterium]MBU1950219.1 EVE domain-containing protein [Candidatus Eisenbacteria bacterium]MBU2690244.1 EVE domain-containing protein [Candidatus Eisenbacteria bacterium]
MNYWLFIVTKRKDETGTILPRAVLEQRAADRFWGLAEKTPNRKLVRKGDKIIFYIALPESAFGGEATLAGVCRKLNSQERRVLSHEKQVFETDLGVDLDDVVIWSRPIPISVLVPRLSFIENKEYWFTYFQGGIRQISEQDYRLITSDVTQTLTEKIATEKDLESESEFALESHLEEFIEDNWVSINWGASLGLYATEEQSGRQFPAGLWSIDFLAIDAVTNDLVVIELKKGKTSDATVGQTLRYVNWVKGNIADPGQGVRAIIIARQIDEALKYAVMNQPDIQVKTYKIRFNLETRLGEQT